MLEIGEVARRTGLSVSAIRFYEARGLVAPLRVGRGRRMFARADVRRLSFILAAQAVGLTLAEIRAALASLPDARTPTRTDWVALSAAMRDGLQARIDALTRLRDRLDGCIGCGCLSLDTCALYNPDDRAGARGTGPRFLTEAD